MLETKDKIINVEKNKRIKKRKYYMLKNLKILKTVGLTH